VRDIAPICDTCYIPHCKLLNTQHNTIGNSSDVLVPLAQTRILGNLHFHTTECILVLLSFYVCCSLTWWLCVSWHFCVIMLWNAAHFKGRIFGGRSRRLLLFVIHSRSSKGRREKTDLWGRSSTRPIFGSTVTHFKLWLSSRPTLI
jgi:hypothetical protein